MRSPFLSSCILAVLLSIVTSQRTFQNTQFVLPDDLPVEDPTVLAQQEGVATHVSKNELKPVKINKPVNVPIRTQPAPAVQPQPSAPAPVGQLPYQQPQPQPALLPTMAPFTLPTFTFPSHPTFAPFTFPQVFPTPAPIAAPAPAQAPVQLLPSPPVDAPVPMASDYDLPFEVPQERIRPTMSHKKKATRRPHTPKPAPSHPEQPSQAVQRPQPEQPAQAVQPLQPPVLPPHQQTQFLQPPQPVQSSIPVQVQPPQPVQPLYVPQQPQPQYPGQSVYPSQQYFSQEHQFPQQPLLVQPVPQPPPQPVQQLQLPQQIQQPQQVSPIAPAYIPTHVPSSTIPPRPEVIRMETVDSVGSYSSNRAAMWFKETYNTKECQADLPSLATRFRNKFPSYLQKGGKDTVLAELVQQRLEECDRKSSSGHWEKVDTLLSKITLSKSEESDCRAGLIQERISCYNLLNYACQFVDKSYQFRLVPARITIQEARQAENGAEKCRKVVRLVKKRLEG